MLLPESVCVCVQFYGTDKGWAGAGAGALSKKQKFSLQVLFSLCFLIFCSPKFLYFRFLQFPL